MHVWCTFACVQVYVVYISVFMLHAYMCALHNAPMHMCSLWMYVSVVYALCVHLYMCSYAVMNQYVCICGI